jgi:Reverse transcriptase (RNA-dependent DNA polymerase)
MTASPVSLQDLRRRIYVTAKADTTKRFWGLYVHVVKPETLRTAYALVKRNNGAPGIDGVTFAAIEAAGVEAFLASLRDELVTRTYRPLRNRRVEIPKRGGKVRVLGIPAIRDRVVQGALKLILEPMFEADFCNGSYGYRPRRTAHEAVARVDKDIVEGKTRVIDVDLAAYFDTVRHDLLLGKVARRVRDGEILHLLKLMLKASGKRGVPQGGVLTPPTQSQTSPGTELRRISGSCIEKIDGNDIDDSILMTHARPAARASGPVRRTREPGACAAGAISARDRSAHAGPSVSHLAAPGPAVCGRGAAASPGIAGAGADGGVHCEAAGQPGASASGPGADYRGQSQFTRDARPRRLAAANATPTRRWRIGVSSTPTCLTA